MHCCNPQGFRSVAGCQVREHLDYTSQMVCVFILHFCDTYSSNLALVDTFAFFVWVISAQRVQLK